MIDVDDIKFVASLQRVAPCYPSLDATTPACSSKWSVNKWKTTANKLRWYPQQPQRFIFTNLSEACCEAKRCKPCWTCSNLTWPCTKDPPRLPKSFSRTFSGTFSGTLLNLTWLCTQSLPDLHRNLLRNPVEPDLALHAKPPRPSPEPSPEPCWTWPGSARKASQTFSGIFSGTLLNLTWLCTKASQNLLRNPVEPDLALHQSLPHLLGNLLRNPVEPDLALHQSLPDLHRNILRKPCWTWPGSAPKPPTPSQEPSPDPCWTWPDLLRNLFWNLLRNPVEPDLALHPGFLEPFLDLRNPVEPDLSLHQSLPNLLGNLRNLLGNLVEPDPVHAPVHTGAILGWIPR